MRELATHRLSRLSVPVTVAVACCTYLVAIAQKPLKPVVMFPGRTIIGNTSAPLVVQVPFVPMVRHPL